MENKQTNKQKYSEIKANFLNLSYLTISSEPVISIWAREKWSNFQKTSIKKNLPFWDSQKDADIFERKLAIYLVIYHLFQVLLKYHF